MAPYSRQESFALRWNSGASTLSQDIRSGWEAKLLGQPFLDARHGLLGSFADLALAKVGAHVMTSRRFPSAGNLISNSVPLNIPRLTSDADDSTPRPVRALAGCTNKRFGSVTYGCLCVASDAPNHCRSAL